MKVNTFMV